MDKKFHFINEDVVIDFTIPLWLQEMMQEAEEADLNNNYGLYENICEDMDTNCKNSYATGHMSGTQWNQVIRRYVT